MAISIHELRNPNTAENPWQSAPVYGSPNYSNPFYTASAASLELSRQAQVKVPARRVHEKPPSRGILKFVNYLYDQR